MKELISPKYQMKLIDEVDKAIWTQYNSYVNVRFYMEKWLTNENERIYSKYGSDNIDLIKTLHGLPKELLLKIAIELGIETPNFIPSIPTFKNELKNNFETAYETFVKAQKQVETNPDIAIGLANSTLESIIKEILKDDQIKQNLSGKEILGKLIKIILKEFRYLDEELPIEVKSMGSQLIGLANSVEKMRSEKTHFHGKTDSDYIVTNPLYAYLTINAVATLGIFLNDYYQNQYVNQKIEMELLADLPF